MTGFRDKFESFYKYSPEEVTIRDNSTHPIKALGPAQST